MRGARRGLRGGWKTQCRKDSFLQARGYFLTPFFSAFYPAFSLIATLAMGFSLKNFLIISYAK
jgi:hypothetical protein